MIRKVLGMVTAALTTVALMGVAWAGPDDGSSSSVVLRDRTSTTVDGSSTSTVDRSSTTSIRSSTSTTDRSTTSTTVDSTTSTTADDNPVPPDGETTYEISGVGTVTIAVTNGQLSLIDVSAPGWEVEIEKLESDRIEIDFSNGDSDERF
jgi:hypothetical protein